MAEAQQQNGRARRQVKVGTVVSDKADKTVDRKSVV